MFHTMEIPGMGVSAVRSPQDARVTSAPQKKGGPAAAFFHEGKLSKLVIGPSREHQPNRLLCDEVVNENSADFSRFAINPGRRELRLTRGAHRRAL